MSPWPLAQVSPSGALSGAQQAESQVSQASGLWHSFTAWVASVDPRIWMWIGIGIVAVIVLFLLYWLFLRIRRRRRARQLRSRLGQHIAKAPPQTPIRAADYTAIRKKFHAGLAELSRSGRDLYTLPWYLVLGNSGAGKTEAIRQSGLDFPEGLHEPHQGLGGTLNMDWWFSNHAILLDTAGRLLMENLEQGHNPEWAEFLQLLRKNRPNCPINGTLLAISAESLLTSSDEELDAQMRVIGEQLHVIEKTLDIRFPVYVIVTKLDLLVGMEPLLESGLVKERPDQMLGWSNPDDLQAALRPSELGRSLQKIAQRIDQLSFTALKDPAIFGAELKAVCLQQLPKDFQRLCDRLAPFVEGLFLPGQWTNKPLFLRGVYFTSAQQTGEPLDLQLASAVRTAEAPLDGGEENEARRTNGILRKLAARYPLLQGTDAARQVARPYFLGDLFLEKIVRESGLVTRASNALQRLRRRRLILFWLGIGLAAAFVAISFFAAYSQSKDFNRQREYWSDAASRFYFYPGTQLLQWSPITDSDTSLYYGFRDLTLFGSNKRIFLSDYHKTLSELATERFRPLILADYGWSEGSTRRQAQRIVYDAGVLQPLILNASTQILSAGEWDPGLTDALGSLIRLRADLELAKAGTRVQAPSADFLDGLLRAVEGAPADTPELDTAFTVAYGKAHGGGDATWPPQWLQAYFDDSQPTNTSNSEVYVDVFQVINEEGLSRGFDAFLTNLEENAKARTVAFDQLRKLISAVQEYKEAESRFFGQAIPLVGYPVNQEGVLTEMQMLLEANLALTQQLSAAETAGLFGDGPVTLAGALATQEGIVEEGLNASLQRLKAQLTPILSDKTLLQQVPKVAELNTDLQEKKHAIEAWMEAQIPEGQRMAIPDLDAQYLLRPGPFKARFYQVRLVSIIESIKWLRQAEQIPSPSVGQLGPTIEFANDPLDSLRHRVAMLYAESYTAFYRQMKRLMDGVDMERDRILIKKYIDDLSDKLVDTIHFPLTYPPVADALSPVQVIDGMYWLSEVKKDLTSPDVIRLARKDIAHLKTVLDGLSLIDPMFAALYQPLGKDQPLPSSTNPSLYSEVLPLGGDDTHAYLYKGKGYTVATASVFLLAYEDFVSLDDNLREREGLYEAAPPPPPQLKPQPTDEYEISGYRFVMVGPPTPTKRVPMGRAEKKNVTTDQEETDWKSQVDDFYKSKTPLPDIWRSLRLTVGENAPVTFDSRQLKPLAILKDVPMATGTLKLELGTTSDSFNRSLQIAGQWSPLRLIMDERCRWHAEKKMWIVPYPFKDLTGYTRYLWLGVQTELPLPSRAEWPHVPAATPRSEEDSAQAEDSTPATAGKAPPPARESSAKVTMSASIMNANGSDDTGSSHTLSTEAVEKTTETGKTAPLPPEPKNQLNPAPNGINVTDGPPTKSIRRLRRDFR